MGLCVTRDKPESSIEINGDLVDSQADALVRKKAYLVQTGVSQEEMLISLAANMKAMNANVKAKNVFHVNRVQRVRKSKLFEGLLTIMKKKLPTERLSSTTDSKTASRDPI